MSFFTFATEAGECPVVWATHVTVGASHSLRTYRCGRCRLPGGFVTLGHAHARLDHLQGAKVGVLLQGAVVQLEVAVVHIL